MGHITREDVRGYTIILRELIGIFPKIKLIEEILKAKIKTITY